MNRAGAGSLPRPHAAKTEADAQPVPSTANAMRIRISHTISYAYAEPARHITQILRLTPRDHDGQHVMSWRIEPTVDGRLRAGQDAYGNIIHTFSADGPITEHGDPGHRPDRDHRSRRHRARRRSSACRPRSSAATRC